MTALSTAEKALRRAPDDPGVPVTVSGAEAAALVAELDRLREQIISAARHTITVAMPDREHDIDCVDDDGNDAISPAWETSVGIRAGIVAAYTDCIAIEGEPFGEDEIPGLEESATKVLAAIKTHREFAREHEKRRLDGDDA